MRKAIHHDADNPVAWGILRDWFEDAGIPYEQPALTLDIGGVDMTFALIPPGEFLMGSPPDEVGRWKDEGPQHAVEITRAFYLGIYPVTQAQWQAVMGSNPSYHKGENLPVERVSWDDCQEFCRRTSELTGKCLSLPSEACWEYACRAGTTTPYHFGTTISRGQANYYKSGDIKTTPVGNYPANAFGLFDMHGNIWEWCADQYDEGYYAKSPRQDPQGPSNVSSRVLRGGSWADVPGNCRAASRNGYAPAPRDYNFGCRVCFRLDSE
jgi:formylglycine-generating enzyme required for sulfatase activity